MSFLKLLKETKIQLGLVLLLTVVVYFNSLFNAFVWDDHLFLETWPDIQTFNLRGIFAGSAPQEQGNVYRPVRGVLWAFSFRLFGANPVFYHLQALLIHLASTTLVYFLAKSLIELIKTDYTDRLVGKGKEASMGKGEEVGQEKPNTLTSKLNRHLNLNLTTNLLPFIAALIFGIHPVHTETINYISASMETWGSLMMFASLTLYFYANIQSHAVLASAASLSMRIKIVQMDPTSLKLRGTSANARMLMRVASVILAILAFFTYEMTLTLPIILVLAEWFYANRMRITNRMYANVAPYFVAAGVFVFIRVVVLGVLSRTDYLGYSFYHTMQTMVQVFVRYIVLLIFPYNQTAIHNLVGEFPSSMIPYDKLDPILAQTIFDLPVLASLLTIGLMGILAIRYKRQYPLASFGIVWFLITLLPVSYIIPHGGAMAEKYLYIPSFGVILAAASLYANVMRMVMVRMDANKKVIGQGLLIAGVGLMVFYGISTVVRNRVWRDDITLFSDVVAKSPTNKLANYTLGVWFGKYGDLETAKQYYLRSIDLAGEFWEARFNLANIFIREENFDKASEQYQYVLSINPNNKEAKNILDNMSLLKESSPSAQGEQLFVNYETDDGLRFKFPASWSIADAFSVVSEQNKPSEEPVREGKTISDAQGGFMVRIKAEDLPGLSNKDEKVRQKATDTYLKGQLEDGTLVQEGLAQIPNFNLAWVKVWEREDVKADGSKGLLRLMQFFLFGKEKVVKVLVYPADSVQMSFFDTVLGSIKLEEK